VSYDAVPEIIDIYKDYPPFLYGINYSAQDHHVWNEVIFHRDKLSLPVTQNPRAIKLPKLTRPLI
jgi:hypothetical protein